MNAQEMWNGLLINDLNHVYFSAPKIQTKIFGTEYLIAIYVI